MKISMNEHKKIHIFLISISLAWIIYAILMQVFFAPEIYDSRERNEIVRWNLNGVKVGEEYVYSHTLPNNLSDGDTLVYYTGHRELIAYVDGKEIYSLRSSGQDMTTGYVWNFISLSSRDAGKKIEIYVRNQAGEITPSKEFLIGSESKVTKYILKKSTYMFVVGVLIMIVGAAIMLVWIISNSKKGKSIGNAMSYFASFAMFLGCWTMSESKFVELVSQWNLALVYIDHGALMMMPIAFILYTKEVYTSCKDIFWKSFCSCGVIVIFVRIILQLTGSMCLRDSLWMTHLSIVIMGSLALYMVWCEFKAGRLTNDLKINGICIVMLLLAGGIEMIMYFTNAENLAFGSTAFLVYVVVNAVGNLLNANEILRRAGENEIFRKMAITDVLTGLGNRLGFQHEFNDRTEYVSKDRPKIAQTTIFMMDLNNLKLCNDDFGHDYGDWYIIAAAKAIEDSFKGKGNVYRIGGDEFAAITSETDEVTIDSLRQTIIQKFEKNVSGDKRCELNIALGCATYDVSVDRLLSDTLKRADALMYENKMQIKGKNKN